MTDNPAPQEMESLTAPGKVLRHKREQLGLSQEEVARRMRLSQQAIKDIEGDDYSHFSAAIYVRGYIRHFATIVKLDSEPLLRAFDEMGFVEQLNQQPRTSYIASSVTRTVRSHYSRRRMARWMSYVFFILLIALVAAWWHGQRHHKHAILNTNMIGAVDQTNNKAAEHPEMPMTIRQPKESVSTDNRIHHEENDIQRK